jgi:uncharacterized protein YkwD
MRKVIPITLVLIYFFALWLHPSAASAGELLSPGDVIAAINQYRAQNGRYAYQSNSILMNTAQDHSNYQASIGSITHTGAGGTRPIDRAYEAGYGDGQIIFVSEIIYGGTNASVNDAVTWWKGSPIHNQQMLATTYVDIGAGVATDGTRVYYTAVMGYAAGGEAPPDSGSGDPDGGGAAVPVLVATPNADGSIVHVVQSGQTLIGIALAYRVTLPDIYTLNNLNENSIIYPGDEILIQSASNQATSTPTSTPPTPSATHTPAPSSTPAFTPTPSPQGLTGSAGVSSQEEQEAQASNNVSGGDSSLRWVLIIAVAGIFFIMIGGLLIPRRKEESS